MDSLEPYETKPNGVFGCEGKITSGGVTIKSSDLDFTCRIKFDDDMQANEAEITIYNLSQTTINQFKKNNKITVEAGYMGDTGIIFDGYIVKVRTPFSGGDRATTIICIDDITNKTITEKTYGQGTKASYILKSLLGETGLPIAVFNMRRDWTYKDEQKVDGDLMENIKKYSEVCGVSTYIKNGKIYSRHIKEGDNLYFTLSSDTGLIGSPQEYEEQITAEDFKETINGYECECLLQHRMTAGGIVTIKSANVNGTYRICSGEHNFSLAGSTTKIKVY